MAKLAPEMFQGKRLGKAADMWACGMLGSRLLTGVPACMLELFLACPYKVFLCTSEAVEG